MIRQVKKRMGTFQAMDVVGARQDMAVAFPNIADRDPQITEAITTRIVQMLVHAHFKKMHGKNLHMTPLSECSGKYRKDMFSYIKRKHGMAEEDLSSFRIERWYPEFRPINFGNADVFQLQKVTTTNFRALLIESHPQGFARVWIGNLTRTTAGFVISDQFCLTP